MEMTEESSGSEPQLVKRLARGGGSTQRAIWAQGQGHLCPLPPLILRELHLGLCAPCQECLITLSVILEDPRESRTSSPEVHPEQRNSKAQSSGMSQLNRQMQHHQLPPAHPSPSAPGKHLSTGREMPQVQALRGCLELGSRLDSFFLQNT